MKRKLTALLLCICFVLSACGTKEIPLNRIDDKYRTFYEVFVYSFYDSDGDGIGDLKGLIDKLDYINDGNDKTDTDLSFDGIWLMPIMPSDSYHKYDVKDYCAVDSSYGSLEDFDLLIEECDKRGVNVIIDLPINHTSSSHEWFTEATKYIRSCVSCGKEPDEKECKYFGYYNFTKEYKSGYYQVTGAPDWYYEAEFDKGMPDLNLFNEDLRRDLEKVVDFWLERGVSGFRLDAVKEFVSDNAPKNIEILTWFNDYVKSKKEDAYLVGECWTNMSTYVQYYASGIDSLFNFAFADGEGVVAIGAKVKNRSVTAERYVDKCIQIQSMIKDVNPEGIDAPFFTNHDMDRAAGYFNDEYGEYEVKMAAALNLLMTGTCFVYYGEEIGMSGSGKDENKRAPMYWSQDSEAEGMCKGPSGMEKFDMKYPSLEEQSEDESSIYNFYKALIKLRNQNPEILRGEVTKEEGTDKEAAVIKKNYNGSEILIIINLSKEEKTLDLCSLTLNGLSFSQSKERGTLYADSSLGKITKEENTITLPGFSIAVYK